MPRLRFLLPALAPLALAAMLPLLAGEAAAQTRPDRNARPDKNDGRWSIEVVTEKGDCDRAYRYALVIEGGRARYAGQEAIAVDGQVSLAGAVKGTIAYRDNKAAVVGQLADGAGTGTWTFAGARTCSGRWNAERRG